MNKTTAPEPIDETVMITRARDAVTKVNTHGLRGVTLLSMQEIEAMVLMLACLGVMPWHLADPKPAAKATSLDGEIL